MARAAGVVGAATLLSRILGFVRDATIAAVFGAGGGADAFIVAFRVPNLWRRLVADGALTVAFIPAFLDIAAREGRPSAFRMAGAAIGRFALLLCGAALLGVWAAPGVVSLLAPGFSDRPELFRDTVELTRIMMPFLPLAGAAAVCMGVLQALDRFAAPALSPVCLNLAMIGAVAATSGRGGSAAVALAAGVVIGGILQLGLQLGALSRAGFRFRAGNGRAVSGLGRLAARTVPAALGSSVFQVNVLVGTLLASFLPEGRVAALYYADRLVEFPLGLIGAALATAALPSLSRCAAAADWDALGDDARFALRLTMFLTIPAAAGLFALREPIVALLFGRGAFDPGAIRWTAEALAGFAVGLPAFAGTRVVASACFAAGDARTPLLAGLGAISVNAALGFPFREQWGLPGIALALAVASAVHFGLMAAAIRRRIGPLCDRAFRKSACQSVAGSVMMSIAALYCSRLFPPTGGTLFRSAALVTAILAGMAVYAAFAFCVRHPELAPFLAAIRKE